MLLTFSVRASVRAIRTQRVDCNVALCLNSHSLAQIRLRSSTSEATALPDNGTAQTNVIVLTEVIHGRKRTVHIPTTRTTPGEQTSTPAKPLSWKWQPDAAPIDISSSSSPSPSPPTSQLPSGSSLLQTLTNLTPQPLRDWTRATFLPVGYPTSVHAIYDRFHVLQAAETFLWSMASVLCSQAMLSALGVGAAAPASASTMAVGVRWALKDGIGEIGKLFFIRGFAGSFDSHPRTWKMVGEASSVCGAFLQLCTTLVGPEMFLVFASAGYALRSIHFSIYNATHMTFTSNFAKQGNVGDIVAKDDSQMTVAHLLGTGAGAFSLYLFGGVVDNPWFLFGAFAMIAPLHVYTTFKLVDSARFEVLQQASLLLVCDSFVRSDGRQVDRLEDVEKRTRWFGEWIGEKQDVPIVSIGGRFKLDKVKSTSQLVQCLEVFKNEKYLILPLGKPRHYHIALHTNAGTDDVIQAFLNVTKLDRIVKEVPSREPGIVTAEFNNVILSESLKWSQEHALLFKAKLDEKHWRTDAVFFGDDEGARLEWRC